MHIGRQFFGATLIMHDTSTSNRSDTVLSLRCNYVSNRPSRRVMPRTYLSSIHNPYHRQQCLTRVPHRRGALRISDQNNFKKRHMPTTLQTIAPYTFCTVSLSVIFYSQF